MRLWLIHGTALRVTLLLLLVLPIDIKG